ncbi:MAG: TonB-dependent receptor plug domain-containing protein [Gemmatimonadota bacterium]|nr:TonB-dependent receptor plug domain-containing protein [Gemmatimonadota bacterium]
MPARIRGTGHSGTDRDRTGSAVVTVLLFALLLPATLAAQDPGQIALLQGRTGVDPEPGSLLAAPARLTASGLPLADALSQLAERSRIQIAFSPTLLPARHRVDCPCTALSTARALDRLLEGTGLGYVELGSQVVVVPRAKPEVPGADGDIRGGVHAVATLTGVVRDSVSLEPVAFARVTVTPLGSEAAAAGVSDRFGAFVVPAVPDSVPVRVDAGAFGYAWARTYDLLPASPLRALLSPVPIGLEGLDVVGSERLGDPVSSSRDGFVIDTVLLRSLPATLDKDVGRAAAVSPSASAPSDFASLPYIRGGSSHGTPVLLDGMRLFNAFHFGGFISAINPEVVKRATVLAGPGVEGLAIGSLSGAIDIATRDGSRDRTRTAGSVGLASSRFSVEGPIGGSASYLVGARRTHPGVLLELVALGLEKTGVFGDPYRSEHDAEDVRAYSFGDLHAKFTADLGGVRRLSVSGYLNSESMDYTLQHTRLGSPTVVNKTAVTLGGAVFSAHYRDLLAAGAIVDATLGHGRFTSDLLDAAGDPSDTMLLGDGSMSDTRADLRATWHAGGVTILAGTQVTRFQGRHVYLLEGDRPGYRFLEGIADVLPPLDLRGERWRLAAYSSVEAPLWSRFSTRAGLRADRFQGLATTIAPFAELSYGASWWTARVSGSRSHQALASLRNEETLLASLLAYDLLLPVSDAPVPRNTELAIGWEGTRGRLRVRLDAYARILDHLRLPDPGANPGTGTVLADPSLWEPATGTARGIEATWSWTGDRGPSVLGSYRWARVSRTVGSRTYTPRFHREHEFELGSSYRHGASSWSARISLASGQPETPWLVVVRAPDVRTDTYNAVLLAGEYNSARLPHYARVDLGWRRECEVSWFGGGSVVPYVTVANLLNRRNVVGWQPGQSPRGTFTSYWCTLCSHPTVFDEKAYRRQLPIIPFIGVEFRF